MEMQASTRVTDKLREDGRNDSQDSTVSVHLLYEHPNDGRKVTD